MIDEVFMEMLKNKEQVVKSLAGAYEQSGRVETGMEKVVDSVLENPSEENLRKMINTTMKCVKRQAGIIKMLVMLNLVYVSGSNYSADVAAVLMKMGRGQEALREMFKQKMGGA